MSFEDEIQRIANAPHGGDEVSGNNFRLRVSLVTDDGVIIHTITTAHDTRTESCTLTEWREAFQIKS